MTRAECEEITTCIECGESFLSTQVVKCANCNSEICEGCRIETHDKLLCFNCYDNHLKESDVGQD